MQDRLGRVIKIGDLVTVKNHPELTLRVNWEIQKFIKHSTAVEVVLKNFIDGSIQFINILDIEKE